MVVEQIVASRRYQPARARGELRASVGWKAVPLLNFYLGDDAEKKGDESRGTKAAVMLVSVPTARENTVRRNRNHRRYLCISDTTISA